MEEQKKTAMLAREVLELTEQIRAHRVTARRAPAHLEHQKAQKQQQLDAIYAARKNPLKLD